MSIAVISRVLRTPIASAVEKFVLVVLADCANDEGGSCYPSKRLIGTRTSMSERQVQRHLGKLIKLGHVSVVANAYGGAPGVTPHYQIHLKSLAQTDGENDTREEKGDGRQKRSRGQTKTVETVDKNASQPIINRQETVDVGGATAPSAPGGASAVAPGWIGADLLARVLKVNPKRDAGEILEAAADFLAEGFTQGEVRAELEELAKRGNAYKLQLRLTKPRVQPAEKKRATARKTALVIDPGRNTRAPGRDYSDRRST